jgi:hypothetical protein
MARIWTPLAVDFFRCPAGVEAGKDGRALMVASLCWCQEQLTDGHIPSGSLRILAALAEVPPTTTAARLVDVGWWIVEPDGWSVKGWAAWNRSADEIDRGKEARAQASVAANHQRHHVKKGKFSDTCPLCLRTEVRSEVRTESDSESDSAPITPPDLSPPTPTPTPTTTTNSSISPSALLRTEDEEDPRIEQVLARIAESRAAGRTPKPSASWHATTIANLRAKENAHVEAARLFEDFPTAPVALVAGRILGEDCRNLTFYKRPPACLEAV